MTALLVFLTAFELFPGPPPEAITNPVVIEWFRLRPDFLPDMADIISVGAVVYGAYGEYECTDGMFKGWPIRFRVDYVRGSSGKPCTYFISFVFVEVDVGWVAWYAPRARFDDITQDRRMRGA